MTSTPKDPARGPNEADHKDYVDDPKEVNKAPGSEPNYGSKNADYFEDDDFRETPTFTSFNPLSDFIFINEHSYAVRSSVTRVLVSVIDEKTGRITYKFKSVWKTDYVDENGNLKSIKVRKNGNPENTIDGNPVRPLFTAEEFKDSIENYRGLLKHVNKLNKNPLKGQKINAVFHWVENAVRSVLTVSDDEYKLISCWITAAHFQRVFNQFPSLIFEKLGYNSGGTVALIATALIPFPVSIFDPTEATLFRLAQMGFSLLIDEIDPDDRDKIKSLNLILDGSFNKDAGIPRASGKGFAIEGFLPYGPKVCIDPEMAIVKYSTLSRAVRINLKKDRTRSETLNMAEFVDKYRHVVNHLYDLFLTNAHMVRKTYDGIDEFSGREKQAFAPVLAIATLVGCKNEVLNALKNSISTLSLQKEGDPTKFVLNALYEYLLENRKSIEFSEFSQNRNKKRFYMELPKLRMALKARIGETHQTDESTSYNGSMGSKNKREWKKVPSEFKMYFDSQKFNGIVMSVLGKWVKRVRGNRFGLQVDSNPAHGEPLDPVLDELEKVLEVEVSYKNEDASQSTYETD